MTWSRMLGYLLAAAGLRWVAGHLWPDADAYLAAGAVGIWLLVRFHRRTRGYAIADALNRGTDAEREALLAKLQPPEANLSTETHTFTLEEALEETLTFTYPQSSRSFASFQFWGCVVLGGFFLAPLALGRVTDPGDGWILFLLGGWIVLAGIGHRRRLRWLGTQLSAGPNTLTESNSKGHLQTLQWSEVANITERRWSRAVEFQAVGAPPITVWPELIARDQFIRLAEAHLRSVERRAA
jgi:hypothetical protein